MFSFRSLAVAIALTVPSVLHGQTITFALPPEGKDPPKAGPQSWCRQSNVATSIIGILNTNPEFAKLGVEIVDFTDGTTQKLDRKTRSFACRGIVHFTGGMRLSGMFNMDGTDPTKPRWWWDQDDMKATVALNGPPRVAAADDKSPVPKDQLAFLDAVLRAKETYLGAKTDFQKGATRPARAKAICAARTAAQVNDWAGKVVVLTTNGDGWGVLGVQVGPDIRLDTAAAALTVSGSATLIKPGSPLFEELGQLQKGDYVRFSGEFFANETDCVRETSLTLSGSMTKPEFLFRFIKLEKVDGTRAAGR